jgi:hypothetical protein
MRYRFGERVRESIVDQIETGVVRQIAIVENETDEPLSWHELLRRDESKRYRGPTLSPIPSITFQNVMNVDQS